MLWAARQMALSASFTYFSQLRQLSVCYCVSNLHRAHKSLLEGSHPKHPSQMKTNLSSLPWLRFWGSPAHEQIKYPSQRERQPSQKHTWRTHSIETWNPCCDGNNSVSLRTPHSDEKHPGPWDDLFFGGGVHCFQGTWNALKMPNLLRGTMSLG